MEHYVKWDHGVGFKWESFPSAWSSNFFMESFHAGGRKIAHSDAFAIQLAAVNPLGPAGLEDWRRRGN